MISINQLIIISGNRTCLRRLLPISTLASFIENFIMDQTLYNKTNRCVHLLASKY